MANTKSNPSLTLSKNKLTYVLLILTAFAAGLFIILANAGTMRSALLNVKSTGAQGVKITDISDLQTKTKSTKNLQSLSCSGTTNYTPNCAKAGLISATLRAPKIHQKNGQSWLFYKWSGCTATSADGYDCSVLVNPGKTLTITSEYKNPVDLKVEGSDATQKRFTKQSFYLDWVSDVIGNKAKSCSSSMISSSSSFWTGSRLTSGSLGGSETTSGIREYKLNCVYSDYSSWDSVKVDVVAPKVDLKVDGSDGPKTILVAAPFALSWTSSFSTSGIISGTCKSFMQTGVSSFWKSNDYVYPPEKGSVSGSEFSSGTRTYKITCSGFGNTISDSVTITFNDESLYTDLKANNSNGPITVEAGQTFTLAWNSFGAGCQASMQTGTSSFWLGSQPINGSKSGNENTLEQKIYKITCSNTTQTAYDTVVVNIVAPAPTVNIKANNSEGPITVQAGQDITLSWTSNTFDCRSSVGSDSAPSSFWYNNDFIQGYGGQRVGREYVGGTRVYKITCTIGLQSISDSVTVDVPLVANLKANNSDGPLTVDATADINLSWTSSGMDCKSYIDSNAQSSFWSNNAPVFPQNQGSKLGREYDGGQRVYKITCTAWGKSVSDTVVVNIPLVANLKANNSDGPLAVEAGSEIVLSWTSSGIDCKSYIDSTAQSSFWSNNAPVFPPNRGSKLGREGDGGQRVYKITCTAWGQSVSDTVVVNIPLTVTLKANGSDASVSVAKGTTFTLSWVSSGIDCKSNMESGQSNFWPENAPLFPPNNGSKSGSESSVGHRVYKITCSAWGQAISDTVALDIT